MAENRSDGLRPTHGSAAAGATRQGDGRPLATGGFAFVIAGWAVGVAGFASGTAGLAIVGLMVVLGGVVAMAIGLRRLVTAHAAHVGRIDLLERSFEERTTGRIVADADGRVLRANDEAVRLIGASEAGLVEALRRHVTETVGDEGWRMLATGAVGRLRVPIDDQSIRVRSVGLRGGCLEWQLHEDAGEDAAESACHREREALVDLLDQLPVGVMVVEGDGRIVLVNRTFADALSFSAADVAGLRLHDLTPVPPPVALDRLLPSDAETARGEVLLAGNGGRRVHAILHEGPLGNDRRCVVALEMTAEQDWQDALRRSEHRFQRLFDDSPNGVALIDADDRLVEGNGAFLDLVARRPTTALNRPLVDLIRSEDRMEAAVRLREVREGSERPFEVRLDGASGPPGDRVIRLHARRLSGASGGGALVVHAIDLTEQKRLETQFVQGQKMQAVGQLAGGVAHDFNNLLTAMIGFCDLLLLRHKPGDQSFSDIMQIKQNANRAANLVRQLLAFSRQQTLQPKILNITDVLAELSNLLHRLIGENIELKMVHGRDLGLVKVDQGQLEQVIINLAVNARDAMPGGGRVTVRTRNHTVDAPMRMGHEEVPAGDYVSIEVADTGVGIPPDNLNRIFEPFFSTKEVGSGTGLGLSTVYGIVRQTGGFVFVKSALGDGATFTILLPAHKGGLEAPGAMASDTGGDLTGVGTILLVEDEDAVRVFSSRALRNKGYQVLEARSGEAALELLETTGGRIDLIVSDVVMPHMDGPTLVTTVRLTRPDLKVIFISGYAEDRIRQNLDTGQEVHFLPKPYSLKQLAAKVKDVLQGR
jgi:two-component system, cell cycle sensor histidine kinase and response regulator CckA